MSTKTDERIAGSRKAAAAEAEGKLHPQQEIDKALLAVRADSLFETFQVGILGTAPLICSRFSEKAARQIEQGQTGAVKKKGKAPRDPKAEVAAAAYMIEGEFEEAGARYGIPTAGFKHALVASARGIDDLTMTGLRGQVFIKPDVGRLSEFWFDSVEAHTDAVRIGGQSKTTTLCYRPYFYGWRTLLTIRFWKGTIEPQQVLQCLEIGGTVDGYGEWRPGKSNSGWAGTFSVISKAEFDLIQSGEVTCGEMVERILGEEMVA